MGSNVLYDKKNIVSLCYVYPVGKNLGKPSSIYWFFAAILKI